MWARTGAFPLDHDDVRGGALGLFIAVVFHLCALLLDQ